MTALLPAVTTTRRERSSAADLRLQWSCAYSERRRDPAALGRLKHRLDEALAALEGELADATLPRTRELLTVELVEVEAVARALARAVARDDEATRNEPPPTDVTRARDGARNDDDTPRRSDA